MTGAIVLAFLWAGVKYLVGAALCLVSFSNPLVGFVVSTAGAVSGIFVFTYGEIWLNEHVIKKYFFKKGKRINKRNRFLIRLKHSGGLPLIALLTPVLLSIPLGCILSTTFIHNRKKIVLYQSIAAVFWGVVIFGAQWMLNLNLAEKLEDIFGR